MATFTSSYYTILNFDPESGTYTASSDSTAGEVTSFDNETPGSGQPGADTFEQGDNMTLTGAISGGGQYVGFYNDGYVGQQGGTYYYFSNTPVSGDDVIPVDPGDFVVCFLKGTMIVTDRGEVPVESLRVGDLVLTQRDGWIGLRPIVWVGRREAAIGRGASGRRTAPVTFLAGALDDGVPFRDLHVSPEHAVLVDGVLVPAGLLVNDETIVQDRYRRSATYYHIETEEHCLLLADGAWSESYLDDANRHLFDNAALTALVGGPGTFAPTRNDGRACLPIVTEGQELERVRARLHARSRRFSKAA